jgi:hypothetical protein
MFADGAACGVKARAAAVPAGVERGREVIRTAVASKSLIVFSLLLWVELSGACSLATVRKMSSYEDRSRGGGERALVLPFGSGCRLPSIP